MRSYCVAQGTLPSHLEQTIVKDNEQKKKYINIRQHHIAEKQKRKKKNTKIKIKKKNKK